MVQITTKQEVELTVRFLAENGTVVPTPNPDQLSGLLKGDLDAVWTVEPWVSRLETEAGGKVLLGGVT